MAYETHQVLLQRVSHRYELIRRQEDSAWELPSKLGEKIAELFEMAPELCLVGSLNEAGKFQANSFGGGDGTVEFLVRIGFPVARGSVVQFEIPVSAVAEGGRYTVKHPRGADVVTYAPMIDESALKSVAEQIIIDVNTKVAEYLS